MAGSEGMLREVKVIGEIGKLQGGEGKCKSIHLLDTNELKVETESNYVNNTLFIQRNQRYHQILHFYDNSAYGYSFSDTLIMEILYEFLQCLRHAYLLGNYVLSKLNIPS